MPKNASIVPLASISIFSLALQSWIFFNFSVFCHSPNIWLYFNIFKFLIHLGYIFMINEKYKMGKVYISFHTVKGIPIISPKGRVYP